jgi:hypothetical protein
MNPSNSKFTISYFSIFSAYIFSESVFLKYHCTFSLYKVTDFTIRVPTSIKEDLLHVSAIDHLIYQAPPVTTTTTDRIGVPDIT